MDCLRRVGSPDRSDYSDDEEEEFLSEDEFESPEGKRRIRSSRLPSRRPSKRIVLPSDDNNNNPRISPFLDLTFWRK